MTALVWKIKPVNNNLKQPTTLKQELDEVSRQTAPSSSVRLRHNSFPGGIWDVLASEGTSTLLWQCPEENNLHFQSAFLHFREPHILGQGL